MADYLRQSPLAHLGLQGRAQDEPGDAPRDFGVAMSEREILGLLDLRGRPQEIGAAVEKALGFALPLEANTTAAKGRTTALWLGPDEWWIATQTENPRTLDKLQKALADTPSAVTDVAESRTCIRLAGPAARDTIAKGCPLDLHPKVLAPGACARTVVAKAAVTLHLVAGDRARGGPTFDLYTTRSFADYLWRWLEDAAGEYGVAIVRG